MINEPQGLADSVKAIAVTSIRARGGESGLMDPERGRFVFGPLRAWRRGALSRASVSYPVEEKRGYIQTAKHPLLLSNRAAPRHRCCTILHLDARRL
jgi:hypothetical protein